MMKHKKTHEVVKTEESNNQYGEGKTPQENPTAGNPDQNNQPKEAKNKNLTMKKNLHLTSNCWKEFTETLNTMIS